MDLNIRAATSEDSGQILKIFDEKEMFTSLPWRDQKEMVKAYHSKNLREHGGMLLANEDIRVMVAERESDGRIMGYLILYLSMFESITGEKEGFIYDYGLSVECDDKPAVTGALFRNAEDAVRERNLKYLIMVIYCDDKEGEGYAESSGFYKEINRIIKKIEYHPIPVRTPDPFLVRKAHNEDLFFVMWLNTQCASFTIPATREVPMNDVQFRFVQIYAGMNLEETEDSLGLIIEDTAKEESIGYLLLKTNSCDAMTGKPFGYVYDLAIHPDYWGKRATQRIMKEGDNYLLEKGVEYLLGDISEDNQRALKTAIKSVGFSLERIRWTKKIAP